MTHAWKRAESDIYKKHVIHQMLFLEQFYLRRYFSPEKAEINSLEECGIWRLGVVKDFAHYLHHSVSALIHKCRNIGGTCRDTQLYQLHDTCSKKVFKILYIPCRKCTRNVESIKPRVNPNVTCLTWSCSGHVMLCERFWGKLYLKSAIMSQ